MFSPVERLVKELSSLENHQLLDVKFFLGNERNITQKSLLEEAAKGLSQIRFGNADKIDFVDHKVRKLTIEQFLK